MEERVDGGSLWLNWSSSQRAGTREYCNMMVEVSIVSVMVPSGGSYLNHSRPEQIGSDTSGN